MSQKITRRRALPRLVLAAAAPIAATTALRCASAVAEEREKPVLHGWGKCYACACPAYSGNYNVCQNCGHNYQTHW